MAYTQVKLVRTRNSKEFIADFKRVKTFVVLPRDTACFFDVKKMDVWDMAKRDYIHYEISDKVYVNRRQVMVIT